MITLMQQERASKVMEIPAGDIFAAVVSLLALLGAGFLGVFGSRLKELETGQKLHTEEFSKYREFVARSYPTRDETNAAFKEIRDKLDKIIDILAKKADRPHA